MLADAPAAAADSEQSGVRLSPYDAGDEPTYDASDDAAAADEMTSLPSFAAGVLEQRG